MVAFDYCLLWSKGIYSVVFLLISYVGGVYTNDDFLLR